MSSLIPDFATLERRLVDLPVVNHRAGEVVLAAGSKTGGLLFLKSGTVEVAKDGVQIAGVNAPGSVFGAVLLDQPHTADVRTLEQCEFYVADAPAILAGDPTVALYVAAILARRLDADFAIGLRVVHQYADPSRAVALLCARAKRPTSYTTAEQRDEVASLHCVPTMPNRLSTQSIKSGKYGKRNWWAVRQCAPQKSRAPYVRVRSKPEGLGASKRFPLCLCKRTSTRKVVPVTPSAAAASHRKMASDRTNCP